MMIHRDLSCTRTYHHLYHLNPQSTTMSEQNEERTPWIMLMVSGYSARVPIHSSFHYSSSAIAQPLNHSSYCTSSTCVRCTTPSCRRFVGRESGVSNRRPLIHRLRYCPETHPCSHSSSSDCVSESRCPALWTDVPFRREVHETMDDIIPWSLED